MGTILLKKMIDGARESSKPRKKAGQPLNPPASNSVSLLLTKQDEQAVREMAYYKWLDAGKPTGRDLEFWDAGLLQFMSIEYQVTYQNREIVTPSSSKEGLMDHNLTSSTGGNL